MLTLACIACAAAGLASPPVARDFTFADEPGRRFDARITAPPTEARVGISVLLIGGGMAWDLGWTAPGSFTIDGKTTQVTINGQVHRDADTLAQALVERGLVVVQWGSIASDDVQGRSNPALARPIPFPESVELARAALKAAREQPEVDRERVVLVGHSLGAARAARIADDGVVGLVALAGAYLGATDRSPTKLAAEAVKDAGSADANGDSLISRDEFPAWKDADPRRAGIEWVNMDRDGDGFARGWELAAADRLTHPGDPLAIDPGRPEFAGGPWPLDILRTRKLPTLAIFGGLDPISVHGPILELAGARGARIEVAYVPQRGHQLGEEADGRFGPLDRAVAARVATWAAGLAQIPKRHKENESK